jgi:hypothetical protein
MDSSKSTITVAALTARLRLSMRPGYKSTRRQTQWKELNGLKLNLGLAGREHARRKDARSRNTKLQEQQAWLEQEKWEG